MDPIYVSYSELDAYRQCPLKWQLNYQQLWSKPPKEGSPLHRGSAWHLIMETHYQTIQDLRVSSSRRHPDGRPVFLEHPSRAKTQEILERCIGAVAPLLVDQATGEQTEQQGLLAWMYQGHLDAYGLDEGWQVLAVEQAGVVPLKMANGRRSRFQLRHKLDLVIKDLTLGQLRVVDHKSAANFSRPAEIDIDDQFGLYCWALGQRGTKVNAIVRSDARTQRNKGPMALEDRFRRVTTHRSDRELANIAVDAYTTARDAYASKSVRSSPAPDRCTWRCDYLEAHLAIRKGIAPLPTIMHDFGYTRREQKHQEYSREELIQTTTL